MTSTPRAVQAATADDTPYSTSSGCATTHSTRRKASSGNGGSRSEAMIDSVTPGNRPEAVAAPDDLVAVATGLAAPRVGKDRAIVQTLKRDLYVGMLEKLEAGSIPGV